MLLLLFAVPIVGAALFLTSGDPLSVGFVGLALVVFLSLTASLLIWERRVAGALGGLGGGTLVLERLKNTVLEAMIGAFSPQLAQDLKGNEVRTASAVPLLTPDSPHLSPSLKPGSWLQNGQATLVSIGLFGTFFGLSYGLLESIPCIDAQDPAHAACVASLSIAEGADPHALAMEQGMSILLGGARTAFSKSVAGIGLGLVWLLVFRQREAVHRDRLRSIGLRIDAAYPVVSRDALLMQWLVEIQKKSDPGELARSGAGLVAGAQALTSAAGTLKEVGAKLVEAIERLSPEALGERLAGGLELAIARQLKPSLVGINTGLEELKSLKAATDAEVKRHLSGMLEGLRKEALTPLAAELLKTQENILKVAELVTESTATTKATALAIGGMAGELHRFQGESLSRLEEFSRNLGSQTEKMAGSIEKSVQTASLGMEAQRLAFEASARVASESFKGLTKALESSGEQASRVILQAGLEAGGVMQEAKGQLAGGIQESLAGIAEARFRLEEVTKLALEDAIEQTRIRIETVLVAQGEALGRLEGAASAIARLPLTRAAGEAALDASLLETTQALTRSMLESQKATELLYETLQQALSSSHQEQARFFTEADAHLATILGGLHRLLDHVATVVQEVRDTRIQSEQ
jgi:hypothetical protein